MNDTYIEGNLRFEFSKGLAVDRFDDDKSNPYGMKSVDFLAEDDNCLYFLEIKDYQHPKATAAQRIKDITKLSNVSSLENTHFCMEMGAKIKDSLLRRYALGKEFTKNVMYLLLINLDVLGEQDRRELYDRIRNHIPSGLNDEKYKKFTRIRFDLVSVKQIKQYGINCTVIQ